MLTTNDCFIRDFCLEYLVQFCSWWILNKLVAGVFLKSLLHVSKCVLSSLFSRIFLCFFALFYFWEGSCKSTKVITLLTKNMVLLLQVCRSRYIRGLKPLDLQVCGFQKYELLQKGLQCITKCLRFKKKSQNNCVWSIWNSN